jgi:hypothetical protein
MKALQKTLIATLAAVSISGLAQAANVHIDDSNPNGTITISWSDFENGFTVNGTFYAFQGFGVGSSVTITPTTTPLTFSGSWISNGGTGATKTLYFVDAGTSHVRDELSVVSTGPGSGQGSASINGSFSSDIPTDLGTAPAGSTTIALTGGSQELVGYLGLPANLTFQVVGKAFSGSVQSPVNSDGSSVFRAGRGVIPIKFALAFDGQGTCNLPPATIALQNVSSGTAQSVDESVYTMPADSGSNFRIDQQACQYVYNLSAGSLATGSYQANILLGGTVVGSATFAVK